MTGFLVTCDASKEKRCLNEVFNVLNDFVDICYPELDYTTILQSFQKEEAQKRQKHENNAEVAVSEEPKPADGLEQELQQMKKQKRIWYTFDLQQKGTIFIKLVDCLRDHIDPVVIMDAILKKVDADENQLTRFTCRLMPIVWL